MPQSYIKTRFTQNPHWNKLISVHKDKRVEYNPSTGNCCKARRSSLVRPLAPDFLATLQLWDPWAGSSCSATAFCPELHFSLVSRAFKVTPCGPQVLPGLNFSFHTQFNWQILVLYLYHPQLSFLLQKDLTSKTPFWWKRWQKPQLMARAMDMHCLFLNTQFTNSYMITMDSLLLQRQNALTPQLLRWSLLCMLTLERWILFNVQPVMQMMA